ncbi:hypothetical protein FJ444_16470 [Aestuariibacter sp. GS-14]|uniref:hypothetical protein n=1 Tax=Aestuariibacter sp. GS-14 TaxID=2590670 RepID=UPI001125E93B|nr:hypothetical protein [Aestuariibacter sp. GS-14]TPV55714.1 hypothetical protein FJ444_16470 [Aestuariibacter sp. GS-14]
MKTEKEILAEFITLVFKTSESSAFDYFSKESLMKGSLTSVRLAANDAIEISSHMRKTEQAVLDANLLSIGLPSLSSIQNKTFREFMKIANRGSIKKELEYRLARSLSETEVLNSEQQEIAYQMLECYEQART